MPAGQRHTFITINRDTGEGSVEKVDGCNWSAAAHQREQRELRERMKAWERERQAKSTDPDAAR